VPELRQAFADEGPAGDALGRRRNDQRAFVEGLRQPVRTDHQGFRQHRGRDEQDGEREQGDQDRRERVAIAERGAQAYERRVHGDGDDDAPDHGDHEWPDDLVAVNDQNRDRSEANERLDRAIEIRLVVRVTGRCVHRPVALRADCDRERTETGVRPQLQPLPTSSAWTVAAVAIGDQRCGREGSRFINRARLRVCGVPAPDVQAGRSR
jgi:hypothetical protein